MDMRYVILALALVLASPAVAAPAGGWDWSTGPTIPTVEYDLGSPNPIQVAPGAGVQVSLTHDAFKRLIFGKTWDLLDVTAMAFGSVVSNSGQQFGALSVAGGFCTMSSLICLDLGTHVLSGSKALAPGKPFLLLAFSFNFASGPPPVSTTFDKSSWAPYQRANTLYFSGP